MNIGNLLFFDIETVSQYETLEEFEKENPQVYKLWDSYFDKMVGRITTPERLPDVKEPYKSKKYRQELYDQTAAFFPEFGKVCCVSVGFINNGKVKIDSYYGENEKEILEKTRTLFNRVKDMGFSLCGHNIKGFDIPFLGKRYYINGMKIPTIFPLHDTKPWELMVVDTKDVWSFGSWGQIGSLDLITSVMGVDSPKNGDVKGDNVTANFWDGKVGEIAEYCEKDVKALIDIMKKLDNLK